MPVALTGCQTMRYQWGKPNRSGGVMDEREQLTRILALVQRLSDEHWSLLSEACRLMDDHAWVGPTARAFAADLRARDRALRSALGEAVDLVRHQLARLP